MNLLARGGYEPLAATMAFDGHGRYMGSGNPAIQGFQMNPGAPNSGQKNYVFVDEHNRHKRLKVMRACEGCRRRKIKCDAATTNTWPCSACRRLKLQCQPPTINQDGTGSGQLSESDPDYTQSAVTGLDPSQLGIDHYAAIPPSHFANSQQYGLPMASYGMPQYTDQSEPDQTVYSQMPPQAHMTSYPHSQAEQQLLQQQSQRQGQPSQPSQPYYSPPIAQRAPPSSSSPLDPETATAAELSEALGGLKIDETGIPPFIRDLQNEGKEGVGPVQDNEEDVKLPPLSTGAGSQIRIPPALLPSNEEASQYFQIFFDDIHPYVPVLNRAQFLRQWQTDRKSISALLLEAIFACTGRLSDDPAQGAQWLALATRHEDHFLDKPRISTLQALLLLLKARESAPKRGYFYKSWMTVKKIVSMAKSLELNDHLADHEDGGTCGSDPIECLLKTRIWQTLMIVEVMVGGPQGRNDFGVAPDTVDLRPNPPNSNINTYEAELTRQFSYWASNVINIRNMIETKIKLRRQKDWYANPKWMTNNEGFRTWPEELPEDLRLQFPPDGSAPFIPSHFIGNMHSHYQLGIIMVQRPQLLASKTFGADVQWRQIFSTCYTAAKLLCRLQEGILARYGISGLLVMQRGVNFTIYGVLTCTMLHLVAITSPYIEFNNDAREFFTRHMRILEQCSAAWPMPDVQDQVESLRMAFSADINRPFELKQSFPYSSPSSSGETYHPSPPMDMQYPPPIPRDQSFEHRSQIQFQSITPPMSTGGRDRKSESPHVQQSLGMPMSSHPQTTSTMNQADQLSWNPSRIITQWDTAFAISPSAMAPTNSPPMNMGMNTSSQQQMQPPQSQPHQQMAQQQLPQYTSPYPQTAGMTPMATPQSMSQAGQFMASGPVFVSPKDWQQSVASVYDPEGLKRRWDPR